MAGAPPCLLRAPIASGSVGCIRDLWNHKSHACGRAVVARIGMDKRAVQTAARRCAARSGFHRCQSVVNVPLKDTASRQRPERALFEYRYLYFSGTSLENISLPMFGRVRVALSCARTAKLPRAAFGALWPMRSSEVFGIRCSTGIRLGKERPKVTSPRHACAPTLVLARFPTCPGHAPNDCTHHRQRRVGRSPSWRAGALFPPPQRCPWARAVGRACLSVPLRARPSRANPTEYVHAA